MTLYLARLAGLLSIWLSVCGARSSEQSPFWSTFIPDKQSDEQNSYLYNGPLDLSFADVPEVEDGNQLVKRKVIHDHNAFKQLQGDDDVACFTPGKGRPVGRNHEIVTVEVDQPPYGLMAPERLKVVALHQSRQPAKDPASKYDPNHFAKHPLSSLKDI